MALDFAKFIKVRPYLYHLTARANLESVMSEGVLVSASVTLEAAGRLDLLCVKRSESVRIALNGCAVWLRDQKPLLRGTSDLRTAGRSRRLSGT